MSFSIHGLTRLCLLFVQARDEQRRRCCRKCKQLVAFMKNSEIFALFLVFLSAFFNTFYGSLIRGHYGGSGYFTRRILCLSWNYIHIYYFIHFFFFSLRFFFPKSSNSEMFNAVIDLTEVAREKLTVMMTSLYFTKAAPTYSLSAVIC